MRKGAVLWILILIGVSHSAQLPVIADIFDRSFIEAFNLDSAGLDSLKVKKYYPKTLAHNQAIGETHYVFDSSGLKRQVQLIGYDENYRDKIIDEYSYLQDGRLERHDYQSWSVSGRQHIYSQYFFYSNDLHFPDTLITQLMEPKKGALKSFLLYNEHQEILQETKIIQEDTIHVSYNYLGDTLYLTYQHPTYTSVFNIVWYQDDKPKRVVLGVADTVDFVWLKSKCEIYRTKKDLSGKELCQLVYLDNAGFPTYREIYNSDGEIDSMFIYEYFLRGQDSLGRKKRNKWCWWKE